MGRSPCSKEGFNRGAWTAMEDRVLTEYIKTHGEGKWRNLPKRPGGQLQHFLPFSHMLYPKTRKISPLTISTFLHKKKKSELQEITEIQALKRVHKMTGFHSMH
ncbi:hypothetical protein FH972_009323 [Carpinus fangiana]|uniref:Myb-like domain-containing protein n=1 Tax=Carpinus fangiana TaxID=176857 RepID=A0A5N6R4L4_9ROSI|nr:hypothetical protein FH972_009323 [Carpinus fangiana]